MVQALSKTAKGGKEAPKSAGTASSADPRAKSTVNPFISNAGLSPNQTSAPTLGDGAEMPKPVAVIVSACNAPEQLRECLETMLAGAMENELELTVVCYGCSDNTADIAKSFAPRVKVVETTSTSKPAALNLVDKSTNTFPRFYVDAAAMVNIDAIRKVTSVLRKNEEVEAAAPAIYVDISQSSWPVRAYYQVWLQRDRVRYGLVSNGVAAVSQLGHGRFHHFPALMTEDTFLRLHFHQRNRRTITNCGFKVRAPRSLGELFSQCVRRSMGVCEIRELFPLLLQNENRRGPIRDFFRLMPAPANWLPMAVYMTINTLAGIVARYRMFRSWHRPTGRQEEAKAKGARSTSGSIDLAGVRKSGASVDAKRGELLPGKPRGASVDLAAGKPVPGKPRTKA